TRVELSPDGKQVLAVARGRLLGWEIAGGRAIPMPQDPTRSVMDARFSKDGKWLAVLALALPSEQFPVFGLPASTTAFAGIWELRGARRLQAIKLSRAIEGRVAIRPDGRQVAVHLIDVTRRYYHNTVVLVDPSDGRKQQPYSGMVPGRLFEFLAYSPDG